VPEGMRVLVLMLVLVRALVLVLALLGVLRPAMQGPHAPSEQA
jgi:hypothetical protein